MNISIHSVRKHFQQSVLIYHAIWYVTARTAIIKQYCGDSCNGIQLGKNRGKVPAVSAFVVTLGGKPPVRLCWVVCSLCSSA